MALTPLYKFYDCFFFSSLSLSFSLYMFDISNKQQQQKKILNEPLCQSVSSVAQSCLTLCDPMDYSMPGFPVHNQLPELTQTHVHWVSEVVQPSLPLSSPPPAFNISHHQGIFQWVNFSHQIAKVLEFQLQSALPITIQDWFSLGLTGWISLQSKGLSRVFSNTTVQKRQFFSSLSIY